MAVMGLQKSLGAAGAGGPADMTPGAVHLLRPKNRAPGRLQGSRRRLDRWLSELTGG